VRSADAFRSHVNQVIQADGKVDLLFNNAGIGMGGEMHQLGVEHFDRVIDINIRGVTNGIAAAYPHMVARGQGAIINSASASGIIPLPLFTPYAMSKHAVVGLTKSAALEFAPKKIRINAVCPGFTLTDMTRQTLTDPERLQKAMEKEPLGRYAEPEEVAASLAGNICRCGSYPNIIRSVLRAAAVIAGEER